jgi:nicotinamidase-related amidase
MVSGYTFIKSGRGAFSNEELGDLLRERAIAHLFLAGSDVRSHMDGAGNHAHTAGAKARGW